MNPVYFRPDRQLIEGIKPLIKENWLVWQRDKTLYKNVAQFTFKMMNAPLNLSVLEGGEVEIIKSAERGRRRKRKI